LEAYGPGRFAASLERTMGTRDGERVRESGETIANNSQIAQAHPGIR
jgi:hypothetical protein